ncbi:MAG: hypothetical protein WA908_10875 [Pontixanthobacter sp.]
MRKWMIFLFICGLTAFVLRTLLDSDFGQGTLVYLAVPFLLSVAIYFFVPRATAQTTMARYLNHMRIMTIAFLLTSAFLFEGFICILMFMPIYYVVASLAFLTIGMTTKRADDPRDVFKVSAIPALMLLMVAEGMVPMTTFPREHSATFEGYSPQTIGELKANMARPVVFDQKRHWFLELFPLPDRVNAASLSAGDIHTLHFTYRRWLVTNDHTGEMHIRISEVGDRNIATRIVRNDSYLANYLKVHGTNIRFTPAPGGGTNIRLTVQSRRLLDPAWYFAPIQHLATKQSARYFIETIVARHPVEEIE